MQCFLNTLNVIKRDLFNFNLKTVKYYYTSSSFNKSRDYSYFSPSHKNNTIYVFGNFFFSNNIDSIPFYINNALINFSFYLFLTLSIIYT